MKNRLLLAACLLSTATVGCSGQLYLDPPGTGSGAACQSDSDCQSGTCENGHCTGTGIGSCSSTVPNGSCPVGETCQNGACVVDEQSVPCAVDAPFGQCDPADVCDGSACVVSSSVDSCASATPFGYCSAWLRCDGGSCIAVTAAEACSATNPTGLCPGPKRCDAGVCVAPACSNGLLEPTEECDLGDYGGVTCADLGFDAGRLECAACRFDTSLCSTCGDGLLSVGEECDGGVPTGADCSGAASPTGYPYYGGGLTCLSDCILDYSACSYCGDGTLDPVEECDTNAGGATCADLPGFSAGTLGCNTFCRYDTSACAACGDRIRQGSEQCDGLDLGSQDCPDINAAWTGATGLICNPDCTFNTSACVCGDNAAGGTESCDGSDLRGLDCSSFFLSGGTLTCDSSCAGFDISQCGVQAFWIEPAGPVTLTVPQGMSGSQAFAAWVSYNDGNSQQVSVADGVQWYLDGAAAPFTSSIASLSANGLFRSSSQLATNAMASASASFAGMSDSTLVNIEIIAGTGGSGGSGGSGGTAGSGGSSGSGGTGGTAGSGGSSGSGGAAGSGGTGGSGGTAGSGGAGGSSSELLQITLVYNCDPAAASACPDNGGTIEIVFDENGAPEIDFSVIGSFDDDGDGIADRQQDITTWVDWSLTDPAGGPYAPDLGALDPFLGIFVPGGAAGTLRVTVSITTGTGSYSESFDLQITVEASFVGDPGVPPDASDYFATACAPVVTTDQPMIVYPHDRTKFPRNVYQVLFQWVITGNGFFRLRFDNDATLTHVALYTTLDRYQPSPELWSYLTLSNAGTSVDVTLEAVPYTGSELPADIACYNSAKYTIQISFSAADVPGAIYYWSTSVKGIKKASINSTNPTNFVFPAGGAGSNYTLQPTDAEWQSAGYSGSAPYRVADGNMNCVACHGLSRDGKQLALSYKGSDELVNFDLAGDVAGVTGEIGYYIAPAGGAIKKRYWPTFNDSGDKIVVALADKKTPPSVLELRASDGGALLGDGDGDGSVDGLVPTGTGPNGWTNINLPDWGPDGRWLAFTYTDKAERDGGNEAAIGVIRYDKENYPGLPPDDQNPWNPAPWTSPLVLLLPETGNTTGSAANDANWHQPAFSPDGKWLVITHLPTGSKPKDDPEAMLWALQWADCEVNASGECVVYPICTAAGATDTVCGPLGDTACAPCEPVALTALNWRYSNCDNADSPAFPCASPPDSQNNLPRWAPTNAPDVYFLVFTSQRPYGKVSGEDDSPASCAVPAPLGSCFQATTLDQLWVAGFDSNAPVGQDPSFPPFWLPFQNFGEANHRAFWTHDPGGGFAQCGVEICGDGLDNDCDGQRDEDCCTVTTEVCNDIDDDCDCPGDTNGDGVVCGVGPGGYDDGVDERDLVNGSIPGGLCCPPCCTEICGDGIDNDCDCPRDASGAPIDTNGDGVACGPGDLGVDEGCGTVQTCDPEICDGIDNDCDGAVDAADTGAQANNRGSGVLPNGSFCATAACPCCTQEVCDGIDNDCDGAVDAADAGAANTNGNPVQFPAGKTCCFPAAADCPPGAMPNNIDDDCNDIIDDGGCCIPDAACYTDPIACELCDNRDNNCNGLVDEYNCCHDYDGDGYSNCAGDCVDDGADFCALYGTYFPGCDPANPPRDPGLINPGVVEHGDWDPQPWTCLICDDWIDDDCGLIPGDCTCSGG